MQAADWNWQLGYGFEKMYFYVQSDVSKCELESFKVRNLGSSPKTDRCPIIEYNPSKLCYDHITGEKCSVKKPHIVAP